ncbi:MAG: hypothetical protein ACREMK_09015 [Gemmatimonadota bacterium]
MPGLPWGASIAEVTAALVERDFDYAGQDRNGDLLFNGADLLGHEALVLTRMYRGRLVKVVAILKPKDSESMEDEQAALVKTLSRFFGPAEPDRKTGSLSAAPNLGGDTSSVDQIRWLRRGEAGRVFGLGLRVTTDRTYRLDFEGPEWPGVLHKRRSRSSNRSTESDRDRVAI